MSILLSVIVPVYNTEYKYLKKCFSVFTVKNHFPLELIIVDDGSNLTTKNMIKNLSSHILCPVKIICKKNGGQNSARNIGLKKAGGKYIAFLDSDDYFDLEVFQRVLFSINRLDDDIIAFNCKEVDCNYNLLSSRVFHTDYGSDNDAKKIVLSDCGELWRVWFKRSFIEKQNSLPENIRIGEDLLATFPMIANSKSITILPESLYFYTKRANSVMSFISEKDIKDIVSIFIFLVQKYGNRYFSEIEWLAIKQFIFFHIPRIIMVSGYKNLEIIALFEWFEELFPNWKKNKYYNADRIKNSVTGLLIGNCHFEVYYFYKKVKEFL